jgi:hypothetical protein
MKNYLASKWKSFLGWSTATWGQGRRGKAKVILAWYALVMTPIAIVLDSAEVQLELHPGMQEPALLCRQEQSFDEIIGATDVTNQALEEEFRHQPEVWVRILTSDSYIQRNIDALYREQMHKIAEGQCLEVTHGDPVKARWIDWQSSKGDEVFNVQLMQVTYQGQRYWTYAAEWQKATGNPVAAEDRAPLMISRKSPDGRDRRAPPVVDESLAQTRTQRRPVPPFARDESYAQVREVLLRDGWQPVISKDADKCMEGDTRCEGRPEMETCSGTGLAMCRFAWHRDGQRLTICTAGEESASFHSVCE